MSMEHFLMVMAERLPIVTFILCRVLPCDAVAWVRMDPLAPVVGMAIWPADTSTPPYIRQVPASRILGLVGQSGVIRSREIGERAPVDHRSLDPADLILDAAHLLWLPTGGEPVSGWILTRSADAFTTQDLDVADLLIQGIRTATTAVASTYIPDTRPAAPVPQTSALTARERQMLELVGTGLTASAIGHRTGISVRTVQKHLQNAYAKLGCGDRLSAVLKIQALEAG